MIAKAFAGHKNMIKMATHYEQGNEDKLKKIIEEITVQKQLLKNTVKSPIKAYIHTLDEKIQDSYLGGSINLETELPFENSKILAVLRYDKAHCPHEIEKQHSKEERLRYIFVHGRVIAKTQCESCTISFITPIPENKRSELEKTLRDNGYYAPVSILKEELF